LELNRTKIYQYKLFFKPINIVVSFISLISLSCGLLNAENLYFDEIQIDSSTKTDDNQPVIPTNPFEMVEMIRKVNSLNDATIPSDAIDDALKLFENNIKTEEI